MKGKKYTMKELPVSEKPYEKCEKYGAGILSDAELLAVVLKTGTREKTSRELAEEVLSLNPVDPGLSGLGRLSMQELLAVSGIGKVKAVQLLCVLELSRRLSRATKKDRDILSGPWDVARFFMEEMRNLETEHFYIACFDASARLLHYEVVFKGTVQSAPASPREILRTAMRYDAANFIVLHNHPSGDPKPSKEDIETTERLQKSADLIGIPLMDHIIIGDNQYVSLRERGYL